MTLRSGPCLAETPDESYIARKAVLAVIPRYLPPEILNSIFRHAEKEYPRECCGLVFGAPAMAGAGPTWEVVSCHNVWGQFSRLRPRDFRGSAKTSFLADPAQVLRFQKKARQSGKTLAVIYHSHIDLPAFFSEQDRKFSFAGNRPLDPETGRLVVSVVEGSVRDARLFFWDSSQNDFAEKPGIDCGEKNAGPGP